MIEKKSLSLEEARKIAEAVLQTAAETVPLVGSTLGAIGISGRPVMAPMGDEELGLHLLPPA